MDGNGSTDTGSAQAGATDVVCGSRAGPVVVATCDGDHTPCWLYMQLDPLQADASSSACATVPSDAVASQWVPAPENIPLRLDVARDGLYRLRLRALDAAGNVGEPVTLRYWVHTGTPRPPTIVSGPPPISLTTVNTLVVSVPAEAPGSSGSPGRLYLYARLGPPSESAEAALAAAAPLPSQPVPYYAPVQHSVAAPLDQPVGLSEPPKHLPRNHDGFTSLVPIDTFCFLLLLSGQVLYRVWSRDQCGRFSALPGIATWTSAAAAPVVTVTRQPPSPSGRRVAHFWFTATVVSNRYPSWVLGAAQYGPVREALVAHLSWSFFGHMHSDDSS
jgi:hypothetical protein